MGSFSTLRLQRRDVVVALGASSPTPAFVPGYSDGIAALGLQDHVVARTYIPKVCRVVWYNGGMANANLVLPDGTTVSIEGTAEEVALLLGRFSGDSAQTQTDPPRGPSNKARRRRAASRSGQTAPKEARGATGYVRELINEDYFKTKRSLGDVKATLEERAHIYPVTSLSPVLFKLTKSRELRRLKEDGKWVYVNL